MKAYRVFYITMLDDNKKFQVTIEWFADLDDADAFISYQKGLGKPCFPRALGVVPSADEHRVYTKGAWKAP